MDQREVMAALSERGRASSDCRVASERPIAGSQLLIIIMIRSVEVARQGDGEHKTYLL